MTTFKKQAKQKQHRSNQICILLHHQMQVKHSVVLVSYFIAGLGGKPDALNHFFLILNVKHHYP